MASAVAGFESAFDVAAAGFARDRFALVIEMLALGEGKFDLGAAVQKIDAQRHDRIAALAHPSPKTIDFPAMHQELARAGFLVAELARGGVGSDMNALQK